MSLPETDRPSLIAECYYGSVKAKGIVLAVTSPDGDVLGRVTTGQSGTAFFPVYRYGEYRITVYCPRGTFTPRAWYCRLLLDPNLPVHMKFVFRRALPNARPSATQTVQSERDEEVVFPRQVGPIHRGLAGLTIKLSHAAYPNETLGGGVYQLWQTF